MKKFLTYMPLLLMSMCFLSSCGTVDSKNTSLSIIYALAAVVSLLLLVGYLRFISNKQIWFILMFSAVLVVNISYFSMAISSNLGQALMANRVAYLGSVLLPLSMLMTILNVTNTNYGKRLPIILICISAIMFFIAASPGILDIYYKDVSFEIVNGAATLVKVYGPLHSLYPFYLLGYFGAMVAVIIHSVVKIRIDNPVHAVILAMATLANIGVWGIEQLCSIDFEILSISYIITELFLLAIHLMVNENKRLSQIVKEAQTIQSFSAVSESEIKNASNNESFTKADRDRYEIFIDGVQELTHTEKTIYEAYTARVTTKEVMAQLNITENTLKFHNKNIYSKLGVSSRKELLEIYKYLKKIKESAESSNDQDN